MVCSWLAGYKTEIGVAGRLLVGVGVAGKYLDKLRLRPGGDTGRVCLDAKCCSGHQEEMTRSRV